MGNKRPIAGAALGLSLVVAGPFNGLARAQTPDGAVPRLATEVTPVEACRAVFDNGAFNDVPSQGLVSPHDVVSLNLTWGTGWKPGAAVEVLSCTAVNGAFSGDLSIRNQSVPNDGLFVHEFHLPAAVPNGATICERAVVIGQSDTGAPKAERLDPQCFTVAAERTGSSTERGAPPRGGANPAEEQASAGRSPASKGADRSPGRVAGAAQPNPPGTAGSPASAGLARTGTGDRLLALVAGLLFVFGGWTIGCAGLRNRSDDPSLTAGAAAARRPAG